MAEEESIRCFDWENNRLVCLEEAATAQFWDEHWSMENIKKAVEGGEGTRFVSFITKKFIKPAKSVKILDGGCGKGQHVFALGKKGYSAYGIDFAKNTVSMVNKLFPELKVSYGDVRRLDFPDGYFDGYWSLGVIEHFWEGFDDTTEEMARVLKKGGILFLTFPHMSPLRKLKARLGKYRALGKCKKEPENFYQFALDCPFVINSFSKKGFKLIYKKPYDGIKGLKDEITQPAIKKIIQLIYDSRNPFLRTVKMAFYFILASVSGHIILLVFKKVTK